MSNDISRRISGSAIAALCLLISGAGLLVLLFLFEPFLRDHHVINLEFGGWLGMGLIALAAIFGATSRRSTLGKTVCILASILVLALLVWVAIPIAPQTSERFEIKAWPNPK